MVDQVSKFYIKLNFVHWAISGSFLVVQDLFCGKQGDGFRHGNYREVVSTLFRIVAVVFLSVVIHRTIKRQICPGFIFAVSVLLAGAAGNIVDSIFTALFSAKVHCIMATLFLVGRLCPIFMESG